MNRKRQERQKQEKRQLKKMKAGGSIWIVSEEAKCWEDSSPADDSTSNRWERLPLHSLFWFRLSTPLWYSQSLSQFTDSIPLPLIFFNHGWPVGRRSYCSHGIEWQQHNPKQRSRPQKETDSKIIDEEDQKDDSWTRRSQETSGRREG